MKIQIKNRFNLSIIFECDAESAKEAVLAAIKAGISLSGANLSWANLLGANLSGAIIFGGRITKPPIQIWCGLRWVVTITETHIQIGCQIHPATDWFNFTDEEISEMHPDALVFWNEHKEIIKKLWESHTRK